VKYTLLYEGKYGVITETVIEKKENLINILNYLSDKEGKIIDLKVEGE